MHNIINSSKIIHNTKRKRMTKFACKGRNEWRQCHVTHNFNMCAFTTPKDFIVRANVHKVFTALM
jgi:hypothetical protein